MFILHRQQMQMKKTFALLAMGLVSMMVTAQQLPGKKDIKKTLRLTNQYFMDKWPDAGKPIFTNIERPSNIWTRSVYYEGLVALYAADKKKAYKDYMLQWGEKHKWNLRAGTNTRNADNQCCGQVYIDLYLMDGKKHPERITAIKASIDQHEAIFQNR